MPERTGRVTARVLAPLLLLILLAACGEDKTSGLRPRTLNPWSTTLYSIKPGGTSKPVLAEGVLTRKGVHSPDGRSLIYEKRIDDTLQFHLLDLQTGAERAIGPVGKQRRPSWSPDSRSIVFDDYVDPKHRDLFQLFLEEDQPRRITTDLTNDEYPVFSPDGTRLVYASGEKSRRDIHLINLDGTDRRLVHEEPLPLVEPDWFPNGQDIVFSRGRLEIWRVSLVTGKVEPVHDGGSKNRHPRVTPDGERIIWISNDTTTKKPEVLELHLKTGKIRQITSTGGSKYYPSLAPDGESFLFTGSVLSSPAGSAGLKPPAGLLKAQE